MVPNVFVDGGSENVNTHVDELIKTDLIRRTVAQIDIEASNSMIEMLFYRLKHRHLFHIPLNNFESAQQGTDFYFTQSNTHIPQAVLKGATPEEIVTGKWTNDVIAGIKTLAQSAKIERIDWNRCRRCTPCMA